MNELAILQPYLNLSAEITNGFLPMVTYVQPCPLTTLDSGAVVTSKASVLPMREDGLWFDRNTIQQIVTGSKGFIGTDRSGTLSANPITAPDGTLTAYSYRSSTVTTSNGMSYEMSNAVAGNEYTFSIFVKPVGNGRYVTMVFKSSNFGAAYHNFDLVEGISKTFGNNALKTKVEKLNNGWLRVQGTFVCNVSGNNLAIGFDMTSDIDAGRRANTTLTVNDGFDYWMPQIELGTSATSPMTATVGSLTTRPASSCELGIYLPGDNFTAIGEYTLGKNAGDVRQFDLFDLSNGTALSTEQGCRFSVNVVGGQHCLTAGGSSNIVVKTPSMPLGARVKFAYTVKDGIAYGTFDGINIGSKVSQNNEPFRKITFGTSRSSANPFVGCLHKLQLFSNSVSQKDLPILWKMI